MHCSNKTTPCGWSALRHGDHFTAGLGLLDVAPVLAAGGLTYLRAVWIPGDSTTLVQPLLAAAHGWCMTLGIELLLADIRIAAQDTRFSQLEVKRDIYPFGGATLRFWPRSRTG